MSLLKIAGRLFPSRLKRAIKAFGSMAFDIYAIKSYSQEGEDMILRRIFAEQSTGFYVDVGAHHPRRFSNTCYFYLRGWRGINIEPNPDAIRAFRRARSRDINLEFGIAEQASTLTYHMFDEPALNTFDDELAAGRVATTACREIATESISVRRLDKVLEEYLPTGITIDFMNVDVEGFDLEVLRSNEWSLYRPCYVLAEALETSLHTVESNSVYAFMLENGYVLYAKTRNTLFFRDDRKVDTVAAATNHVDHTGNMTGA